MSEWLHEEQLVQHLVSCFAPNVDESLHYTAALALSDVVACSVQSQNPDVELLNQNVLIGEMKCARSISALMQHMYSQDSGRSASSSIVHGSQFLLMLLKRATKQKEVQDE